MSRIGNLDITITGESHSKCMRMVLSGIKSGTVVKMSSIEDLLYRRQARKSTFSTTRIESDKVNFVSGVETDGDQIKVTDVIVCEIENKNTRSSDYGNTIDCPRPSHADLVQYQRYGKIQSGGGKFSGRLTAPLCIAGGIAKDILGSRGIEIYAYVSNIGGIDTGSYCSLMPSVHDLQQSRNNQFALLDSSKEQDVANLFSKLRKEKDSVGGSVECVVFGLEGGSLGDNLFDGLEGQIARAVFGIPAVKGVEFGLGVEFAKSIGSEVNDCYQIESSVEDDNKTTIANQQKRIVTTTNNNGGINGGIANGMPVTLRVAFKPTPSIGKVQKTVSLKDGANTEIEIKGRHDTCFVPRATAVVESAVAIALLGEIEQ